MDKTPIAVLATVFAGGFIALQAPINAALGKAVGSFPAASISFAIGTAALVGDHRCCSPAASARSARSAACPGTTCSAGCWGRST